jgi:hypothetical protein
MTAAFLPVIGTKQLTAPSRSCDNSQHLGADRVGDSKRL